MGHVQLTKTDWDFDTWNNLLFVVLLRWWLVWPLQEMTRAKLADLEGILTQHILSNHMEVNLDLGCEWGWKGSGMEGLFWCCYRTSGTKELLSVLGVTSVPHVRVWISPWLWQTRPSTGEGNEGFQKHYVWCPWQNYCSAWGRWGR